MKPPPGGFKGHDINWDHYTTRRSLEVSSFKRGRRHVWVWFVAAAFCVAALFVLGSVFAVPFKS
jgi:hypothetical protein